MAKRILAVDDDPSVREMVRDYLTDNEFEVVTAANGAEMQRELDTQAIDLVILDVKMPGQDGFDLARKIRSRSPLPIIMLTAQDEEVDRVLGLELGADDYLTKPFSPRELLARIRAVLRRQELASPGRLGSVRHGQGQRRADDISIRGLGAADRRRDASCRPRRPRGGAHARGVLAAPRIPALAAPNPLARPTDRGGQVAHRGLRPLDRRAHPAAAPQDRGKPQRAAPHPHRAHGRVLLRRRGHRRAPGSTRAHYGRFRTSPPNRPPRRRRPRRNMGRDIH